MIPREGHLGGRATFNLFTLPVSPKMTRTILKKYSCYNADLGKKP